MKRHFLKNPHPRRERLDAEKSWKWSHFKKMEEKKEFAFSNLCMNNVTSQKITAQICSSCTWRDTKKVVYKHHLEAKAVEKLAVQGKGDAQRSIKLFLITCPRFEQSRINWMISTYQPLCCYEEKSFSEVCFSLSKNCQI